MVYKTDYQQKRLYAWERAAIAPHDQGPNIPYDQVQAIVNYIWEGEGLKYPPLVKPLQAQARRGALARANRHAVYVREDGLPTWVLIHELAHSMTNENTDDDICGHHGKAFVGVYLKLAFKWLGVNPNVALNLAKTYNVKYDLDAKPIFLD